MLLPARRAVFQKTVDAVRAVFDILRLPTVSCGVAFPGRKRYAHSQARDWAQPHCGGAGCGALRRGLSPRRNTAIEKQHRLNEQIRITPVRVITDDGQQLGVIPTADALAKARETGLDLVEVAPDARPPVCKIMDFGKFKYQQGKKKDKGKVHQQRIKEIRVRPRTDHHDIDVKVNRARTFLEQNDKVLVAVQFRGRELAHIDEGMKVITEILEKLEDIGKPEAPPKQMGKKIECRLAPK